jgi:TonB-dependent receptor
LPYSYYAASSIGSNNVFALDQTSATATSTTLKPSQGVAGDIAIPDRHEWYFYDNLRTRPGAFTRFDFNDHHRWHAHLEGGIFAFKNDESRYLQYLNRVGPADILTASTGSFAEGAAEVQYDKYIQWRQISYVDFGVGTDLDAKTHIDLTLDYGLGHYRQNTAEDQFATPTTTNLAFNYNLDTQTAPLFTPLSQSYFSSASNYSETYHLNEVDQSKITQPVARLDFTHNFEAADRGLGFSAGAQWKDATQVYSYFQYRLNPIKAPTLATMGALSNQISFYDSYGQTLLAENVGQVDDYLVANAANYTEFSSDKLDNTINNYTLHEAIEDGYVQADYRTDKLYALLGVRYEATQQKVQNYLPSPFNSTTNFVETTTPYNYNKVLPSFNLSYALTPQLLFRGAATETLARPEYSQLAENSSATVSGNLASETVSNPSLKPRQARNYDASIEWYPTPDTLASVAYFVKDIRDEIVTLTTTEQNATVPGYATPVALTITEPQNVGKSGVQGVELNFVDARFSFLPGPLSGLGLRANVAFMSYDAPYIRMSDGSLRHLPQLTQSAHEVANLGLLYSFRAFSAVVSYNHTGKQPISFDTNNAVNDQWWASIDTIDFEARYAITPHADLRFSAKNLTDSRPQKVVGPSQGLNYSTLENGRAFFFGIGFKF